MQTLRILENKCHINPDAFLEVLVESKYRNNCWNWQITKKKKIGGAMKAIVEKHKYTPFFKAQEKT